MDFTLRCNSLKCRSLLSDRAVVTTCSHIFCIRCSDGLGLSNATGNERICPACEAKLADGDDAVVTQLHPPEGYKTSILSGFSPTIIMECAGRGLAFYTYQATQEIVYQEYLAKSLTEKCNGVGLQMDQLIHDANAEISHLRNKLATIELDQSSLRRKNQELIEAYNDKARSHAKSQAAYDGLKKRMLQSDFATAAANAVEESLHSIGDDMRGVPMGGSTRGNPVLLHQSKRSGHDLRNSYSHVREGSSSSNETNNKPHQRSAPSQHGQYAYDANDIPSSSQQRSRLPVPTPQARPLNVSRSFLGHNQAIPGNQNGSSHGMRRPLASLSSSAVNHTGVHGYAMTTAAKSGHRLAGQETWGNSQFMR